MSDQVAPSQSANVHPAAPDPTPASRSVVEEAQALVGPRWQISEVVPADARELLFRADDRGTDTEVVVRLLAFDPERRPDVLTRLQTAVRKAAKLSDPRIATPAAVEEREGVVFLTRPFVDGWSLEQILSDRELIDVEQVFRVVTDIAGALDHAHSHGVVHRGLTPSNVIIERSGQAFVTDFGIADALREEGETRALGGARAYAAPEQWRGRPGDARTDQYSLAVIAYELLSGTRRLDAPNVEGIQTLDPLEVHAFAPLRPDLPLGVNAALRAALSGSPANRFASAKAFADALCGKTAVPLSGIPAQGLAGSGWWRAAAVIAAVIAAAAAAVYAIPQVRVLAERMVGPVSTLSAPGRVPDVNVSLPSSASLLPSTTPGSGFRVKIPGIGAVGFGTGTWSGVGSAASVGGVNAPSTSRGGLPGPGLPNPRLPNPRLPNPRLAGSASATATGSSAAGRGPGGTGGPVRAEGRTSLPGGGPAPARWTSTTSGAPRWVGDAAASARAAVRRLTTAVAGSPGTGAPSTASLGDGDSARSASAAAAGPEPAARPRRTGRSGTRQ